MAAFTFPKLHNTSQQLAFCYTSFFPCTSVNEIYSKYLSLQCIQPHKLLMQWGSCRELKRSSAGFRWNRSNQLFCAECWCGTIHRICAHALFHIAILIKEHKHHKPGVVLQCIFAVKVMEKLLPLLVSVSHDSTPRGHSQSKPKDLMLCLRFYVTSASRSSQG